MELFRICRESFSKDLRASGIQNRWNLRGQLVIYAGSSRSLATLEMVVHRSTILPDEKYKVIVISVPDKEIFVLNVTSSMLPENWRLLSSLSLLQRIGNEWYREGKSLLLKVPSIVIPEEYNYVINTEHPLFATEVKVVRREDYFWDRRLL